MKSSLLRKKIVFVCFPDNVSFPLLFLFFRANSMNLVFGGVGPSVGQRIGQRSGESGAARHHGGFGVLLRSLFFTCLLAQWLVLSWFVDGGESKYTCVSSISLSDRLYNSIGYNKFIHMNSHVEWGDG